jgi:hypothetical protein
MLGKALLSASVSASAAPGAYVEDVFSTYLYTGNGSTQTITNDIDLAGEGGLVWIKNRSGTGGHRLFDTARGVYNWLASNSAGAQQDASPHGVTAFNSNGFAVSDSGPYAVNDSGATYASWTFRKAPRFFDVVTYAGNGVSGRAIPHNLGTDVGMIIVKWYDGSQNWAVWHRTLTAGKFLILNGTNAENTNSTIFTTTAPTSTEFYVGSDYASNGTGANYVAYLFAHDPLGPSGDGSDGLISCGSYTGNGSADGPEIDLGWEPQWVMFRRVTGVEDWIMFDNMRGMVVGGIDPDLRPNQPQAEGAFVNYLEPNATGFKLTDANSRTNENGDTYIYIAIRRGPMRAPESGTEVFAPISVNTSAGAAQTTNFPVDLQLWRAQSFVSSTMAIDRLRGVSTTSTETSAPYLLTNTTDAETASTGISRNWGNTGFEVSGASAGLLSVFWNFRRAPGFFDVVAYSGTGTGRGVPHNLGVTPEMAWIKARDLAGTAWFVHHTGLTSWAKALQLQSSGTQSNGDTGGDLPTATTFPVNASNNVNGSGYNYIAYLFATVPGVSKVGSYTGTGTTLSIDCGFTAGARFVLIKRRDSTGDWYVWDTARGISSGNDPYLLLNSTAAEVTNTDYIDPLSSGFQISSTAPAAINASGGTYIFLAIA